MTIPKYDEIMPIALEFLATKKGQAIQWRELETPIAERFSLTKEEVATPYESGNGKIFLDRVSWALSYLAKTELITRPKRGFCQITEAGLSLVGNPDKVLAHVKLKAAEHEANRRESKHETLSIQSSPEGDADITPQESLDAAAKKIRETVYEDILDTILSKTPYEFEKLVVDLLSLMGYGGKVKDAAQVTQRSNDGGIDGIIKEDILGLGRIHIQAKRYKKENAIGREDIQKFVGALAVSQSNKGVFITTSYFSNGASDYASNLNGTTTVVLIDGQMLAEYIYEFGLGMQIEQTIQIKRLDSDFWDELDEV